MVGGPRRVNEASARPSRLSATNNAVFIVRTARLR